MFVENYQMIYNKISLDGRGHLLIPGHLSVPKTGFLVSFFDDNISPCHERTFNILRRLIDRTVSLLKTSALLLTIVLMIGLAV